MSKINPLQAAFYKGVGGKFGAVQFNIQNPHYYCPSCKARFYDSTFPPNTCSKCNYGQGENEKIKSREGAIFVEICSANGKNSYGWKDKIVFSLSAGDISQLLVFLEGAKAGDETSIQHDPGAGGSNRGKTMKYLNISTPNGLKDYKKADDSLVKGGAFIKITEVQSSSSERTEHRVPLNAAEVKMLAVLFRAAIPVAFGWV